jgi:hypothetical protein
MASIGWLVVEMKLNSAASYAAVGGELARDDAPERLASDKPAPT